MAGEPEAVLSLPSGQIPGRPVGSVVGADGVPPTIHWQSPAFEGPFGIPLDSIVGISFPAADGTAPSPGKGGEWRVELRGGDSIVGRLEAIDDTTIRMSIGPESAPVAVPVRRESVRRLIAHDGGTSFVWNGSLDQAHSTTPSDWRKNGSGLTNTKPGAMLSVDAGTDPRTRYDLSLSWTEQPVVRIAFGGTIAPPPDAPFGASMGIAGYRLELAERALVVIRDASTPEGRGRADLDVWANLPNRGITLSVFVDRGAGRIAVARSGSATPIADLTIAPTSLRAAPAPAEENVRGGDPPPVVMPAPDGAGPGFRIEVVSGEVTLEKLRIGPWRGEAFADAENAAGGVDLVGGGSIAGGVVDSRGDPATLTVRSPDGSDRQVPLASVAAIRFPVRVAAIDAGAPPLLESPPLPESPPLRHAHPLRHAVRVADRSGSSLIAALVGVAEESVTIAHPAIDGTVAVPVATVRSIDVIASTTGNHELPGRVGRLTAGNFSHEGCLVPIDGERGADGLAPIGWQPRGSLTAAAFAGQADGSSPPATITYRDAPDADGRDDFGWIGQLSPSRTLVLGGNRLRLWMFEGGPLAEAGVASPMRLWAVAPRGDGCFIPTATLPTDDVILLLDGRAGSVVQLRVGGPNEEEPREIRLVRIPHGVNPERLSRALETHARLLAGMAPQFDQPSVDLSESILFLVTGESIACRIDAIDETGLRVRRSGAEPVTVPAGMVKALELVQTPGTTISPEKFRSLTTLPRSQQQAPPTQLVRSLAGDYLRGRLVGMDGDSIRMDVEAGPRGKPLVIPRPEVARVIWLHPDPPSDQARPPAAAPLPGLPVEAVLSKRSRMRMAVAGIEGNVLAGRHPVLGPCRIDVGSIDRLLIGGATSDAGDPPFAKWQLHPATEPRNLPPSAPAAD